MFLGFGLAAASGDGRLRAENAAFTPMSAETLQTYQPSGKFAPAGLVVPLVAAAVVSFPLGILYSLALRWIPFVYINLLATCAYGFALGWLARVTLMRAHVRHAGLATLLGVAVGCIGIYFEWSGFIYAAWEDGPLFSPPGAILGAMAYLYEHGSWGMKSGGNVTGPFLAFVWLCEAGAILVFPVLMARALVTDTPYCEKSRCWLDEEKKIDTLEAIADPAQRAALKAGDIMPVVQAKPRGDGTVHTRLLLKRSPKCRIFCTVRVQEVSTEIDKDGKTKSSTADLTGDLILPASMFDLIAQFENIAPAAPPAA
jgi:hypothetical protein